MKPYLVVLPVCCALAGCGIPFSSSAIERTPEGVYLKQTIERLMAKDFTPIEAALDPTIKNPKTHVALEQVAAQFPAGKPTTVTFLGWNGETMNGGNRRVSVTAEYGYTGGKWLLVSALLAGASGDFRILGLHVQPLPKSLEEINAFTFSGKGWLHYFVLVATALALATAVYAFVLCLQTSGLKRKWLWALFVSVGFCGFTLNWTSGEFHVGLLQVNLFSASMIRTGFAGPWFVTYCIPVGALVFLSKRKKRRKDAVF